MAYRIDFDHPLRDEVARIASEELSAAARCLEQQPAGPHEAIHDARKHLKRTRALYRLIASGAREFAAAENLRLRDIAARLSHLRETAALAESARYLASRMEAEDIRAVVLRTAGLLEERRERIDTSEAEIAGRLAAVVGELRSARAALAELHLPKGGKKTTHCLAAGWQAVGKKAARALEDCAGTHESQPFHDLRKRTQDRWMHAALLRAIWPSALRAIQNEAKALVDLLGHEHDLAVLDAHLATAADFETLGEDREILRSAIFSQRQELQSAARAAARDIFRGGPRRDAAFVGLLVRNR
jgi:hypothetical protein